MLLTLGILYSYCTYIADVYISFEWFNKMIFFTKSQLFQKKSEYVIKSGVFLQFYILVIMIEAPFQESLPFLSSPVVTFSGLLSVTVTMQKLPKLLLLKLLDSYSKRRRGLTQLWDKWTLWTIIIWIKELIF